MVPTENGVQTITVYSDFPGAWCEGIYDRSMFGCAGIKAVESLLVVIGLEGFGCTVSSHEK